MAGQLHFAFMYELSLTLSCRRIGTDIMAQAFIHWLGGDLRAFCQELEVAWAYVKFDHAAS